MKKDHRKDLGRVGEEIACRYLQERGYVLIERNYRTRQGEIDLIMGYGPYLVFVEVKTRSSTICGDGGESITRQKKFRMRQTAFHFLQNHPQSPLFLRFDVILIMILEKKISQISHLIDAF